MPISRANRKRYPANWKAISERIRFERAGGRCECRGECGRTHWDVAHDGPADQCAATHGQPIKHNAKLSIVVLTVAHLDHQPENCADDNLKAMCQACHLRYDREEHARTRATNHPVIPESSGEGESDG